MSPRLDMEPTQLRTVSVPLIGTQAAPIVPRAPYSQRVLIAQSDPALANVFISAASSVLSNAGAAAGAPANGLLLPVLAGAGVPIVIALAKGQPLFAATTVLGSRVTLAISGEIPVTDVVEELLPTSFRRVFVRGLGQPVQIVPTGAVPRRVVMRNENAANIVYTSVDSSELANTGLVIPGNAFELRAQFQSVVFVLPPHQGMYAIAIGPNNTAFVDISVSDLQTGASRGETGLPGPASQE